MPIEMTCVCGRKATVADEHAGKRAKCPSCGVIRTVPRPRLADDDVSELPEPVVDEALGLNLKRVTPDLPDPPLPISTAHRPPRPPVQRVTIVDFEMPFGSMVIFAVKWSLAMIPAILILGAIGVLGAVMLAAMGIAFTTAR